MLSKEFERTLDVKDKIRVRNITVVQGDLNSNIIYLNLENGGNKYDLTDTKVEIVFAKPDGTTVLQSDIDIINAKEGKIKCVLRTNTIAVAGVVDAEVKVRNKENNKLLTSRRFTINVVETLLKDETIESTDDFDILTKLIKEVERLIKEVSDANVSEIVTLKEELQLLQTQLEQKQQELIDLENEVKDKEIIRDEQYLQLQKLEKELLGLKVELLNLKEILENSIPFINDKGNWQIRDEDTGIKAQGPKGDKGEQGEVGPIGPAGGVNSVNGLKGEVTLTGDNIKIGDETISDKIGDTSELETESKDLVNAVNEVKENKWGKDELEIGGRNLMKKTSSEPVSIKNIGWGVRLGDLFEVEGGKPYTVSAFIEPLELDTSLMIIFRTDSNNIKESELGNVVKAGDKDIVTITSVAPSIATKAWVQLRFTKKTDNPSAVNVSKVKVEKGTIATDWTPAPEDVGGVQTQPAPVANMNHVEYLEKQIAELRELIALRGLSR